MRKALFILALLLVGIPSSAFAYSYPVQGGTGTNQIPTYGQILVGTSAGVYTPTATSSLGITGGGGSTTGLSTTSPVASSNLLYYNASGAGSATGVATTTASCSGTASCTPFTVIGSSPVTINASGVGTGLSTSSPTANNQVLVYNSSGAGSAYSVATTSVTAANGLTGSITTLNTGGVSNSLGLASISGGNVLGSVTTGVPTALATSSLYGTGLGGQYLSWENGVPQWIASTTYASPLAFTNNQVTCATCLTANQNITLTGVVTGSGSTAITTAFGTQNAGVLGAVVNGNTTAPLATSTLYGTGVGGYVLQWSNTTGGLVLAATSSAVSGVTNVTATAPIFSSGGATPNITWAGLATTSQPSSSNLLVSNGGAGVYGVSTSTLTTSGPLTGSFVQVGSGGSLGCTTASSGVTGCLSGTDWNTFNGKQATLSATWPEILTGATLSFGWATTSQPSSSNVWVSNGSNGFYGVATTSETCSTGVSCTAHAVLTGGGAITLASMAAGVLGTAITGVPTSQATSTLYGTGTGGQVLMWSNTTGGLVFAATSSASGGGGIGDPFTHTSVYGQTTSATSTLLALTGSPYSLVASSSVAIGKVASSTFSINQTTGQLSWGTPYPAGNAFTTIASTSAAAFTVNDGFGTNILNLLTASTSGNTFEVDATTTGQANFAVDQYGGITASSTGATPTLGSCGTGSPTVTATSNDETGDITTGTSVTTCAVVFAHAKPVTPEVFIQEYTSTAVVPTVTSRSTTGFTVTFSSSLSSENFGYWIVMP